MQSVVCCKDSLKSLVLWRTLDAFRPFRPSFGFFGFFGSRTWRQVSFGLLAHHMPARQLRLTELNSFLDNFDNLCATVCDRVRHWTSLAKPPQSRSRAATFGRAPGSQNEGLGMSGFNLLRNENS